MLSLSLANYPCPHPHTRVHTHLHELTHTDYRGNPAMCERGDDCRLAHSLMEVMYHKEKYKTKPWCVAADT